MNVFIELLKKHIASSFIFAFFAISYLYGGHAWLDEILPINGKPLAVFTLVGLAAVYELTNYSNKKLLYSVQLLSTSVEVGQLTTAVNAMYFRFNASGDDFITNEYTIKEVGQLIDTRKRLGVNSYVEGRLRYLQSKIRSK